MNNRGNERRRIQRILTSQPIIARIGAKRVTVMDLSLTGAKVAHDESIGRVTEGCVLEFDWDGQKIALRCEIRRTQLQRSANPAASRTFFHSGLHFVETTNDSGRALRGFVEHQVMRAIDDQKASARLPISATPVPTGRTNSTVIRHETTWKSGTGSEARPQEIGFTILV